MTSAGVKAMKYMATAVRPKMSLPVWKFPRLSDFVKVLVVVVDIKFNIIIIKKLL